MTQKTPELKIIRLAIHPNDLHLASATEINDARIINMVTQRVINARPEYSGFAILSSIDLVYAPPSVIYDEKEMKKYRKKGAVFMKPLYRGGSLEAAANVFCPEDSPKVIERLSKAVERYIRKGDNRLSGMGNPIGYAFLERQIAEPPQHHLRVYPSGRFEEKINFNCEIGRFTQPEQFVRKAVAFAISKRRK